jgi:hypothetical protein
MTIGLTYWAAEVRKFLRPRDGLEELKLNMDRMNGSFNHRGRGGKVMGESFRPPIDDFVEFNVNGIPRKLNWPLYRVVEKLIEAADILWESLHVARDGAREWLRKHIEDGRKAYQEHSEPYAVEWLKK